MVKLRNNSPLQPCASELFKCPCTHDMVRLPFGSSFLAMAAELYAKQ